MRRPILTLLAMVCCACTPTVTQNSEDGLPMDGRPGEPPQDGPRPSPSDDFYRLDVIQRVSIEVAPADIERMNAALPDHPYVPATFRWGDVTMTSVGLRYKNSPTTPITAKVGYALKFDEFVEGQRFLGLKRIAFDNGTQGGSVFSVPVLSQIFAELGLVHIRSSLARITLNGTDIGVYVNEERIDKTFLSRYFADNDGDLYKSHRNRRGSKLTYLGDNPSAYAQGLELVTNETTSSGAAMIDLVRTINLTEAADFPAALAEKFDIDEFLRTMAALVLAGAHDQYTGRHPHNYYLYLDPTTNKWHYLPHDMDNAFCVLHQNYADNIPELWNAAEGWYTAPAFHRPIPLVERIIATPELLAKYRGYVREYLEGPFLPTRVREKISTLYDLARSDLETDPYPKVRSTHPREVGYDAIVDALLEYPQVRYDVAHAQLR